MAAMIQLEAVSKQYGKLQALRDLSVDVRPGAVGLLGPNGAGKSTLIKLLLGLVRTSAGRACVLGHDTQKESRQVRELTGYLPEDDCYFTGLKGVESVAYSGRLAGMPAMAALRRAHEMLDYVRIGDERYREVQTFSTGMKQKVKLAQALIHSPKLVFLDEPTSGLDPQGRSRMLALVRDLAGAKGVSVVVSTHILSDVERCCDSVLLLGRGRLLVYDTLDNLRRPVDESYHVRIEGDAAALARSLAAEGCQADELAPGQLRVRGTSAAVSGSVLRSAARLGIGVRQLAPSRNSLEEIFLKATSEDRHADS